MDPAYTTVGVGPRYEVGEDKIGIPIPGLNYDRKARGSQASTSTPSKLQTSPIKDLKEEVKGVKPVVGTIPAVPSEPFVMPPLKEYEEGIELVQRLSSVEIARIVGNIIDLDGNSANKCRDIALFVGINQSALKTWLGKRETTGKTRKGQDDSSETDETLEKLRLWLRHEAACYINSQKKIRTEASDKAKKKIDKKLVFPDHAPGVLASFGLVNVPSTLTNLSEQGGFAASAEPSSTQVTDALPSSTTTTTILEEDVKVKEEVLDDEDEADNTEKATRECAAAFGMEGDLRHLKEYGGEESIHIHTELLFDKPFNLSAGETLQRKGQNSTQSPKSKSEPCSVCIKLKTMSKKCGTPDSSVNCLRKTSKEEEIQLPGRPMTKKSSKRVMVEAISAKEELARLEKAMTADPVLAACAPSDEVEGEILAHQYELIWHVQANRTHLKSAAEKIGKQLEEDNSEQADRKANLDEANVYLGKLREVKRQLKKEKREADQKAALERAKAAVGDGRREPKPKREIGSAAVVLEPKPEPPVYKPPSAQTVMKAIEAAPTRVKKMFGLANFDGTASHLKPFSIPGTPRSGSPVLGGSPIRSPMSQILLDPFHSTSDNDACCVCAGTSDASKMNQTVKCSQCELIVHPSCYGVTGKTDSKWLCWVCQQATANGRAIVKNEKASRLTLQGKMALYRDITCILCPVKLGAFKKTVNGKEWCHVACAQWVPEASIVDKNKAETIKPVSPDDVPRERRNASCSYCTRSNGTLMRCCHGHCQIVFHPLCCRRAACHMRAVNSEKQRFTAYCEKHTKTEREKDIAANLIGDPIPALVELYNQSPLERQLSGGLQRQLSGSLQRQLSAGNLSTLPGASSPGSSMHGAIRRMRETMRAKGSQKKRSATGELPNSRAKMKRTGLLPGNAPKSSSSLAGFDSEENFGDAPEAKPPTRKSAGARP